MLRLDMTYLIRCPKWKVLVGSTLPPSGPSFGLGGGVGGDLFAADQSHATTSNTTPHTDEKGTSKGKTNQEGEKKITANNEKVNTNHWQ